MKSEFTSKVEYGATKCIIWTAGIVPKSWLYGFLGAVARLFYRVSKKRRNITINNLQHAYPEKSHQEVIALSKAVYSEISKTLADILLMVSGRVQLDDMVVNRDEAIEKLKQLKQDYSNGFVFMGAHFSNWELAPLFASKYGFPMVVIGREGDNKLIDKKIIIPFREAYGNSAAYKRSAGITMVKELKKGGSIGVLIDQKVNKSNGILVNFFGRKAFTTNSIAMLKRKLNPLIIPISIPRIDKGKYRLDIGEPIEYIAEEISDESQRLLKMTELYNQALEEMIRVYPSQWFWMHDRWNKRV